MSARKAAILRGEVPPGMSAAQAAWYREFWSAPQDERPHNGLPVLVPYPPELQVTPEHPRAVVTVAAGKMGEALLEVSGPLMAKYAERVGADFLVLTWPGAPGWRMSAKYGICRAFDHYERIIYFDADVIVREAAPNLFAACEPDEVGFVDELPFHRKHPSHGVENDFLAMRERLGFAPLPMAGYLNTGTCVASKIHRPLFEPPASEIPAAFLAEQHLLNCRLQVGVADGSIKLKLLPRECNYQEWTDRQFRKAPPTAVLHFSGMKDRSSRVAMMRRVAEGKPLRGGPGNELKALLAEIGFQEIPACECNKKQKQMDRWGVAGCLKNRAEIVRWLRAAASLTNFYAKIMATPKAMAVIPPAHWLDPISWLVDESIRRAD